jgi:hypothetical protein
MISPWQEATLEDRKADLEATIQSLRKYTGTIAAQTLAVRERELAEINRRIQMNSSKVVAHEPPAAITPVTTIKYLKDPARHLVESGLLQEINRTLMHPLGLALAVEWPETPEEEALAAKSESAGIRIWDNQNDPEGIIYDDSCLTEERRERFCKTVEAALPLLQTRLKILGYVVQGSTIEDEAKRAYKAYGASTGGKNFRGDPMPKWDELPGAIREAWRHTVGTILGLAGAGRPTVPDPVGWEP